MGCISLLQLENDAELTAHIHQVKELELKLKQLTEDTISKRSQQATVTTAVQVDTTSKQLMSLQDQLQSQESHCAKLSKDLERSYKEVHSNSKTTSVIITSRFSQNFLKQIQMFSFIRSYIKSPVLYCTVLLCVHHRLALIRINNIFHYSMCSCKRSIDSTDL